MAAGIASGFVRKLYRILDHESDTIVSWDPSGLSFSIHDADALNQSILPQYFRGRLSAFRQQLIDHGFQQLECEDDENREAYHHPHFVRGCPGRLSQIVRNPKSKGKAAAANAATGKPMHVAPPASLTVSIAPVVRQAPLTVTLNTGKRTTPVHAGDAGLKRLRATSGATSPTARPAAAAAAVPTPAPSGTVGGDHSSQPFLASGAISQNPLFSNEPDPGIDVARVFSLGRMSDTGLFPCSTDLPEPISYLTNLLGARANSLNGGPSSTSTASSTTTTSQPAPVFSEDMIKSALFFLVSTSTTGTGDANAPASSAPRTDASNRWAATAEKLSTSGLLSSLFNSSATCTQANDGGVASCMPAWAADSNPLFSDTRSSADEDEEDSIWSLLVASSIDRVKTALPDLQTPQERLRLILEERERLEEQRKKIFGVPLPAKDPDATKLPSADPAVALPSATKSLKSALKKTSTATNSLFATAAESAAPVIANPLFSASASSANPLFAKSNESSVATNPLFSDDSGTTVNPLFSRDTEDSGDGSSSQGAAAVASAASAVPPRVGATRLPAQSEDGLWRLLMSSSVDWLRKSAAEFDV